jgi:hypothetical protein
MTTGMISALDVRMGRAPTPDVNGDAIRGLWGVAIVTLLVPIANSGYTLVRLRSLEQDAASRRGFGYAVVMHTWLLVASLIWMIFACFKVADPNTYAAGLDYFMTAWYGIGILSVTSSVAFNTWVNFQFVFAAGAFPSNLARVHTRRIAAAITLVMTLYVADAFSPLLGLLVLRQEYGSDDVAIYTHGDPWIVAHYSFRLVANSLYSIVMIALVRPIKRDADALAKIAKLGKPRIETLAYLEYLEEVIERFSGRIRVITLIVAAGNIACIASYDVRNAASGYFAAVRAIFYALPLTMTGVLLHRETEQLVNRNNRIARFVLGSSQPLPFSGAPEQGDVLVVDTSGLGSDEDGAQ